MAESFASYLAKNYVAKKGFRTGTVPEAQRLISSCDIVLTRGDGFVLEIICIVDAESDPGKRFTLSIGEIEDIVKQCAKYTGRMSGSKLPVAIRVLEVSSLPFDSSRHADMRFYRNHSGLTTAYFATAHIDTINKTVIMDVPFNGLFMGRKFIEKLLRERRQSDAYLQKAATAPAAVGKKVVVWSTYMLVAVLLGVFGAEQYFAASPPPVSSRRVYRLSCSWGDCIRDW
jgi:hypothetical protein